VPRPRVVLVHGSVVNGDMTWSAQRPLAEHFELVIPNRRGFPPGGDVERVDFEDEAEWLDPLIEPGTHLVGHSYGGVISLFAAARYADRLRSLTLIEPPAFGLAPDVPAVEAFNSNFERLSAEVKDPAEFLSRFLSAVGSSTPPGNFSPALLQGARTLMVERSPAEADPPLDELAAAPWPKLVVSGAHNEAFDAVCDVLEERLGAERAVVPGAGHNPQLADGFNERLLEFLTSI